MNPDEKKLFQDVPTTFGSYSQINMAIEEMAELTVALCHWKRKRPMKDEEIITEIADVQIMMDQMALLFGEDAVKKERQRKIERLDERLRHV